MFLAIYTIGKENGSPYLVAELPEGDTLRDRLAGCAIPERKAVEYAGQIAWAVSTRSFFLWAKRTGNIWMAELEAMTEV